MGLFSLTKIFGVTIRESATDGSDFTNPDADYRRLFLGEDGALHLKDSAGSVTDVAAGGDSHGSSIAYDLGGDVTMTTANTGYDGPSGTPAAGTYDIFWKMLNTANGSNATTFRNFLLKGATEIDYAEVNVSANNRQQSTGFALGVVLDGSTAVKVQSFASQSSCTISRNGGNGTQNDATKIELRKTH